MSSTFDFLLDPLPLPVVTGGACTDASSPEISALVLSGVLLLPLPLLVDTIFIIVTLNGLMKPVRKQQNWYRV